MPASRETRRLEQELNDQLRRLTNRQTRDLVAAWAVAWDEISQDLTPVLADMLVAGERVTAGQMIRSTKLRRALTVVAGRLEVLAAATGVRITRDLRDVIDTAGWAQASVIDSQLPPDSNLVDLQAWARVDPRQVDAIVSRSTEQITSRTRELGPVAAQAVRRELVRGVAVGSNSRVTARRILDRARGEFAGGLTQAMTIARTETLDAHRAAAAVGQAQHADVLAGWMWLAALSSRTCPACFGMHGTIHDLDEPGPEGHQNCRCARSPVVKPWRELGIDVPEPAPLVQDADAYFAGLTPRQQQDILGKHGYQAWLLGEWPRSKWATKKSTPGWRDSWVVAQPPKLRGGTPGSRPAPPKPPPRGHADDPAQRAATRILSAAAKAEPAVTKVVQATAVAVRGRLTRLETRLKTRNSIVDKLTRPGVDPAQEADDMKDALRYTMVVQKAKYARSYEQVKSALSAAGCELVKDPGGWRRAGYRGLNLAVRTPDGYVFELQLHTATSLRAAESVHLIYEEQRRLPVGSERWSHLQAEMDQIFESVPWPPGVRRID